MPCSRTEILQELCHQEQHNAHRAGEDNFLIIGYLKQAHREGEYGKDQATAEDPPVGRGWGPPVG